MKKKDHYILKSFQYYKKISFFLVFCALLGLTRVGIQLVEPQIISLMVDRVIKPASGSPPVENSSIFSFLIDGMPADCLWPIMGVLSAAFFILVCIYFITFYARWNIIHCVSLKVENQMRTDVLRKINRIGPGILKKYTNGELISIANSDTANVKDFYVANVPFLLDDIFYLVMAGWFLCRTHVLLMICPVVTFTAYLFITRGFIRKSSEFYEAMWKNNSALNTEVQESIYGIRTIKACAGEALRSSRFFKKCREVRDFYIRMGKTRYRYFLFYDAMDQVLMVITMAVSIFLASRFLMTDGEYAAFLGYLVMMANCLVDILFIMGSLQEFKVSARRAFGLLSMPDPVTDRFGTESVSNRPRITFSHVSVSADEKELLRDVSVDIPYGKKVGVMGKTGSGKSVFLKVMQGFTDCSDGQVALDGKDFHAYDRAEIARAYSYAMQDVFLFSNTIAANIEFYQPENDREKIERCGRLAEVDEFAFSFADGYDTIIGEKGFGLSGGQKQRVAIARALYKDAPVIVLDDCTSALDVETEHKIFENLKAAAREKTLILATHRAPALTDCDEILFFEDGAIVERGTFEELMAQNGRYAAIYKKQIGEV